MTKNSLAFVFEKCNQQSISPLMGAIETNPDLNDVEIHLLKPKSSLGEQVEALALRYHKVVLGFSFTTLKAPEVFDLVQQVRDRLAARCLSNVTLVAGGPHPSGNWRGTLDMGFDLVVVGEGESSFPKLLAALYSGDDLGHLRGLAYRKGSVVRFTGRSERIENLDDFPPFAERFGLFSSIEITRGCPWACRFCQTTFLLGGRMRHRSIENITKWAEVSKRRNRPEIRFVTPDAFAYGSDGKQPRLDLLCGMLKAVNEVVGKEHTYLGSFPSEVRPETVSEEAVGLIRRFAANDNLVIGAQSGSQGMLDLSHRGHTVEDIYRAVRITLQAGLTANVDFIFGMPGEKEADRELTRMVIEDLAAIGARIHSHTFMPLAGTPWANSPPGRVDPKTRNLLERLTGTGQQFGQWRAQQDVFRVGTGCAEAWIPVPDSGHLDPG
ncbi:MAG: TIGR04013 family B12-binding domain/radical SAM domain-containing protein [Anaerolineales bacterium]|nr:MAG: TIGR04013 family B12-binding domain/radical SAM domain-containing protein [Anaerolineales bacterium]